MRNRLACLLRRNGLLVAIGSIVFAATAVPARADVQITGFSNMSFGSWGGTGDMVLTNDLCVYNSVDANYRITASGSGGSFQLVSGGNSIPYAVEFKKSGGSYSALTHGSSAAFNGANTASVNCGGSTNSTLRVTVTQAALDTAHAGSYGATLTVLVEPGP